MRKRWLLHLFFWTVYLVQDTSLEYAWIISSFPKLSATSVLLMATKANLALLPVKLLFSYFIMFFCIDRGILRNRKLWKIITELIIALIASIILHRLIVHYYIEPHIYMDPMDQSDLFQIRRMLSAFLDIGFVAGGAVAMKFLRMYWVGREREKKLEKEKLESELKFLKTQTNPHFLFNTLNNIYALARKKSDDTADVVMKLSKLLRFMLYESRKDRIQIGQEIRMIEDYLELEKIRYNERLLLRFEKDIDDHSITIAPLLLLPFIENAFKHGASETRFDSFIDITMTLREGILQFDIGNSKDGAGKAEIEENIGLSNVRRQLQLIYKDYNLQIQDLDQRFVIHLTINLYSDAAI
jgi:two-component system LytT family sensor kinase